MTPKRLPCLCSAVLATVLSSTCRAFTRPASKRKAPPLASSAAAAIDGTAPPIQPHWVPWELVELASDDMQMTREEFARTFADVEAYTSCDDEGDDFHECDFFGQYLGPTKWLHLTPEARASIDEVHFRIWNDVWKRPHEAVEVADKVSGECLRYYNEFMLEPRTSATKCPTDRPLVRVKVVPASFGLDGFEDAVWEATEDLLERPDANEGAKPEGTAEEYCKAITFVVAAPDLSTDPILMEGGGGKAQSPQVEFESDRFREFASALRSKLVRFSKMEGVPFDDAIELASFHPMWNALELELDGSISCKSFPYPCVAVSTKVEAE